MATGQLHCKVRNRYCDLGKSGSQRRESQRDSGTHCGQSARRELRTTGQPFQVTIVYHTPCDQAQSERHKKEPCLSQGELGTMRHDERWAGLLRPDATLKRWVTPKMPCGEWGRLKMVKEKSSIHRQLGHMAGPHIYLESQRRGQGALVPAKQLSTTHVQVTQLCQSPPFSGICFCMAQMLACFFVTSRSALMGVAGLSPSAPRSEQYHMCCSATGR